MAATTAGGQQKGKSTDKNKKCFHSPSTSFLLIYLNDSDQTGALETVTFVLRGEKRFMWTFGFGLDVSAYVQTPKLPNGRWLRSLALGTCAFDVCCGKCFKG